MVAWQEIIHFTTVKREISCEKVLNDTQHRLCFCFSLALSASFRGRSLKGCSLNLPVGYTGFVMKEEKRPFTEEEVNFHKLMHETSLNREVLND